MKKNLVDRITSKSNLHDHLKLKKGKPGGSKYGTFLDFNKDEARSKSTINPKKTNRQFLKHTPSINDMDIKKLIGKYPIQNSSAVKQENKNLKVETIDIIRKINEELTSGKTKKYCNYIDMGMLNE
jgi:hypothetical protein